MTTETMDIIAYFEGSNAFDASKELTENPYEEGTVQHLEWLRGWNYQNGEA